MMMILLLEILFLKTNYLQRNVIHFMIIWLNILNKEKRLILMIFLNKEEKNVKIKNLIFGKNVLNYQFIQKKNYKQDKLQEMLNFHNFYCLKYYFCLVLFL